MLTSDKAPYIVALLVTILGWHVSQLTEEIRSGHAVGYRLSYDEQRRELVAEVRNASRTKSIVGATFMLACRSQDGCFEQINPGAAPKDAIYGFKRVLPPNAPAAEFDESISEISVKATLAAGGILRFGGKTGGGRDAAEFYFVADPEADDAKDLYIYDSASVQGFVIENYFFLVLLSLIALLVLLVGIMVYSFMRPPVASKEEEAGAAES